MKARLRIGGYQGERSVHTRAVRVLIDALSNIAGARIELSFEPDIAARGRKVADLLPLVEAGDLDLCYFSSSYLADRVPALGGLDIPFHFADRTHARRRLDGELGALLKREIARATDYEALAFWDNGLRHISNRLRPIRSPEDCAGLKIRTLPSAAYHSVFSVLGMEPVTIDVSDMMRAIAAGEVDAQENPLANIRLFGIDQYHPFVTLTGHFHGIAILLASARTLAAWPSQLRQALDATVAEATDAQWRLAEEEDAAARLALADQGVTILELDDAQRRAFQESVRPIADDARRRLPGELLTLLANEAR